MIDFHTHILPDIDDGSGSVGESVRMIEMLISQGVKKILLTPHFYAYLSSVDEFISKKESSLKKLIGSLREKKIDVDLYSGCEVLFFEELWRVENLKSLCIQGTNYIMLEMPFSSWENSIVENVGNLVNKGVTPIIVHFERYLRYKGNDKKIMQLVNMGALLQMNCDCLKKFFLRGKALRYVKKGLVCAIGTDCHNISKRVPDFGDAIPVLKNKLTEGQYQRLVFKQRELVKNATKVYSLN